MTVSMRARTSAFVLLLGIGLAGTGGAIAQETLRLGHDQPTAHGYQEAGVVLDQRLQEATDGAYQVRIFPGAQLGNEMAMLDAVMAGNLDMSIAAAANAATFVPELGLFSVSYLFEDLDHFKRVLNDEAFNEMIDGLIEEKGLGLRRIATFTAGVRNVYNNRRPVESVEDLGNMKMRVMASPIESQVWTELGTLPVSIPFGDVYTGMQTGLVEGAENAAAVYGANKHYEVAPYYSLTGHQWLIAFMFMNEDVYQSLPEDAQAAIDEIGRDMTDHVVDFVVASDADFVNELQEQYGVQVNEVDTAAFVDRLSPLQDKVAADLGVEAVLDRIRELR
jgi:TRAP-type transport system periplasmic protein